MTPLVDSMVVDLEAFETATGTVSQGMYVKQDSKIDQANNNANPRLAGGS